MSVDPKDCPHPNFFASVNIARLEDSGKFVADIRIKCTACEEPFRFVGVAAGLRFDGPTCSIDGTELHAPIEPELEKMLHAQASYQMPEIPKRH